ncbi:MAG: hypothetical protein IT445_09920 [Phycisphaeraceae bacterium]|nr:hypothetical protein [Phycisphaeraceae bacterium]
MLPSLKQRLILLLAVLIGTWCLLIVRQPLQTIDQGPGLSLLIAQVGLPMGLAYLLLGSLAALVLGVLASGAAHPLAGVFSISLSLAILAVRGGAIDGLLWRADSPRVYLMLALESLIWVVWLVMVIVVVARSRLWVRRRFPRLTTEQHFGTTTKLRFPGFDALLAGLTCATVGGLASWVLLTSTDSGQVFGGLMISFALGGLIAQQVVNGGNPAAIVLSPMLVAISAYLYVWMKYPDMQALLLGWNTGQLPALARALPIHYASAAVAGCIIGVTLAQAIEHARNSAAEAA